MFGSSSEKIPQGSVLFVQGESYGYFYFLESGNAEVLCAENEFSGMDQNLILSHSRRTAVISAPAFILPFAGKTVRAVTPCSVKKESFPEGGFAALSSADPAKAINMLICLFKRTESVYADMTRYVKLYQAISRFMDNMISLHSELSARPLPSELQSRVEDLNESIRSSGGYPNAFPPAWLIADNSDKFQVSYDVPGDPAESVFDKDAYSFLKRFLKINKNIFAHVIKADPGIPLYMFDAIMGNIVSLMNRNYEIHGIINAKMKSLFAESESLSSVFCDGALSDWVSSMRLSPDFVRQFGAVCQRFYAMYDEVTGANSQQIFPGFRKMTAAIQKYQTDQSRQVVDLPSAENPVVQNTPDAPLSAAVDSNVLKLYVNSLQQIFEFGVIGFEQQQAFIKAWNDFKKLPDPMGGDDVQRKVRRGVSRLYWEIYSAVFVRARNTKNVPAPVRLMLRFGFIDEKAADAVQIMAMHNSLSEQFRQTGVSVQTEEEFLTKIWNGEEPPSMTEMGQSYEAYLREIAKTSSRKGPDPMEDLNDPVKKIAFEISNRLFQTSVVCSGSVSTAFPIFNNFMIKGNIENIILTKNKINEVLKELVDTDYSAFYRETVLKMDSAREVIEEEVLPYIIILPVFGTKTMMWQELVGINKRSRARIVVPAMFMGDLTKSLAHSMAVFRWEILRTVKGGMWADPVEGGLTGVYQDYVQFFKKNSRLSPEAKEKIQERLRSHRNNVRELFAEDYILWVRFEKNGIMKMNNVSRDLFYRFIPFRKEVRERLERMPAFSESAIRFKNIRKRTFDNFERKFRKYTDETGALSEDIQKYMNYLQM